MNDTSEKVNPFLAPHLPLFEQIDIENDAKDIIRQQIDQQKIDYESFERSISTMKSPAFGDVFCKLSKITYPLSRTFGIISHLSSVCDTKTLRHIKNSFRNELVELSKSISQSEHLYNAMKRIQTDDVYEQRVLKLVTKSMERGGVNLKKESKSELVEIGKQSSELATEFSENVLDSTKAFKCCVDDKNTMEKTPLWCRELWNPSNPEEGPWTITLSGPSMMAALKHIPDRNIRKDVYMSYITRAEKNETVIQSLMDLSLKKANILGYKSFTELSLDSKMASSEDQILKLLNDLQEVALPKAIEEYKAINEYATIKVDGEMVEPWDISFWSERMREEMFQLKEEELKPYFALDNVLSELFSLAHRLFGIFICQREAKVEVWEPSVRFFDVYEGDKSGDIIAGFYLDPYVREETKRGGAWMDSCIDKDNCLGHTIPIAYLVCNGSPPSKDKPSLMSFSDVETLFHEFGHGLQHMLTRIELDDISGINGIEWDAVELPSQFMENWCYEKEILNSMAKHYETGETLPTHMYEAIMKQKNYGAAMSMMRQISFAKLDLYLYSNWKEIREKKQSLWDIQKRIFTECCPYKKYTDEDRFLCSFQHIFGGYSAGYYSYKWAEVMSADCFGMFEEHQDDHSGIGRKFRNTVLANGGSKPAMETFIEFRGREPNVEALLRHNQLTA